MLVMMLLHHFVKAGSGLKTGVGAIDRLLCGFLEEPHRWAMDKAQSLIALASSAAFSSPSAPESAESTLSMCLWSSKGVRSSRDAHSPNSVPRYKNLGTFTLSRCVDGSHAF